VLKRRFHQTFHYPEGVSYEVRTNSLGLRMDAELDLSRTDRRRVLLVGDSFTFGEGLDVEHNFASLLQAAFDRERRRVDVINAGVGGWGTLQEVAFVRDHLHDFRPDAVVLTFCGNDPDDDDGFLAKKIDNARGRFYFPGKIFLREHSRLYQFLYIAQFRIRHARRVARRQREHPELVLDGQSSTMISEAQWRRTLGYLDELAADYARFAPRAALLVQATYPTNESIRAHLPAIARHSNAAYVDLHDGAIGLGGERLRLPYDGHWTKEMHELSARMLHDELRRRLDGG
jgi:lysophospholipase L1-like esterase